MEKRNVFDFKILFVEKKHKCLWSDKQIIMVEGDHFFPLPLPAFLAAGFLALVAFLAPAFLAGFGLETFLVAFLAGLFGAAFLAAII